MRTMTSTEIRNMWYDFFTKKGHYRMQSAPLIPKDDDSLLWINAGVTPLKKYFDGTIVPPEKRIVNIQKCIRTNDIENVGKTARHQTFFEMMGNFSIGDYFKKEAIAFAYELLTSDEYFAIPLEKLYVTVYTHDQEAYDEWVKQGFMEDHIIKLDGNFWEIGEGPCGPDSEIFYDRGSKYDVTGDALEKLKQDVDQDRYVEIWNNVFSQFNAKAGQKREEYQELPHKNIDTGAGLERWACIFQDVDSNFDTDLFVPIIRHIEDISGMMYSGEMAFKVIADHIRAITMALSDGATFGNVGRGYVLRRLLRRSVRYGKKIGITEPFMYELVETVVMTMKDSYPELLETQGNVKVLILQEEELFHNTLSAGEKRLYEWMEKSQDHTISGKDAFKLYDTYGFPFELTLEYLEEKGFTTSKEEFDQCMEEQKQQAKRNRKQSQSMSSQNEALLNLDTPFTFLYQTYKNKAHVVCLFEGEEVRKSLNKEGYVIVDESCFYATSGGQVADTGMIVGKNFKARVLEVSKAPHGQHIHKVKVLDGRITVGDEVEMVIDLERRKQIEVNHSTVHLLQYALQQVISDSIRQAGSYVDADRLRFDFLYHGKINDEEIVEVENQVNDTVQGQFETRTVLMPLQEAIKSGAMALFEDKYGDEVRVVEIADSRELCGGTHVKNTREIKRFAITNFESKGSDVYRIEGVTNQKIESALFDEIKPYNDEMIKLLMKAKNIVNQAKKQGLSLSFDVEINNDAPISYKDILYNRNELSYIQTEVKNLEKTYDEMTSQQALTHLEDYQKEIETIGDKQVLIHRFQKQDVKVLKDMMDALLNQMHNGFIFFTNEQDGKVTFLIRNHLADVDAGEVMQKITALGGGNGGGSKTFAQGGVKQSSAIDAAILYIKEMMA